MLTVKATICTNLKSLRYRPFIGSLPFEKPHFYCEMTAQTEAPSGRELDFRPAGEGRLKESAVLNTYDCKRSVCLRKSFIPPALSIRNTVAEMLTSRRKALVRANRFLILQGVCPSKKALFPGDDLTLRCINREDWVQAPPAREDRVRVRPAGRRWDAPTVHKK